MKPYNPLDKIALGRSIQSALLNSVPLSLADVGTLQGAGVYVLYYEGALDIYAPIAGAPPPTGSGRPMYIGKAIPKGGRKGGLGGDAALGTALRDRLRQHAQSIDESVDLSACEFHVRALAVDDIWIPLGENILIEDFRPVWNIAIDGFGNKTPGRRRATQFRSPWDVLHPGRAFAVMLADSPVSRDALCKRVVDYLAGRPLDPLPKALRAQEERERAEVEAAADEA